MNIQPVLCHQRRRTGMAVLVVDAWCLTGFATKDLHIPDFPAGAFIKAQDAQRVPRVLTLNRGGEVQAPAFQDWRGPSVSRNRLLPHDVPGAAPLQGQAGTRCMPLAGRSPELRPFLGGMNESD